MLPAQDLQRWSLGADNQIISSPASDRTFMQQATESQPWGHHSPTSSAGQRLGEQAVRAAPRSPLGAGDAAPPAALRLTEAHLEAQTAALSGALVAPAQPLGSNSELPHGPPASKKSTSAPSSPVAAVRASSNGSPKSDAMQAAHQECIRHKGRVEVARLVYTTAATFPACCVFMWLCLFLAILSLGLSQRSPRLSAASLGIEALLETDDNATLVQEAFEAAISFRSFGGLSLPSAPAAAVCEPFDLRIIYQLDDENGGTAGSTNGLFDATMLRQVAAFEQRLKALPEWRKLCDRVEEVYRDFCSVGVSLVNYALPTLSLSTGEIVPNSLGIDGLAKLPLPLAPALHLIEQRGLTEVVLPSGFDYASQPMGPRSMRTVFRFRLPCLPASPESSEDGVAAADPDIVQLRNEAEWEELIMTTVFPVLHEVFEREHGLRLQIFFDGTNLEGQEILHAVLGDRAIMAGCWCFVIGILALYTRRILLTLAGASLIALPLPMAYVIFSLLSGSTMLSVPMLLSMFYGAGVGVDLLLLYTDAWLDSAQHLTTDADRIVWTYAQAGKITLVSTALTAVTFMANLASVLKPLRELGVYMALCATFSWVIVSVIYVPLCLVDERYCGVCRSCGCGKRCRRPSHPAEKQRRSYRRMGRIVSKTHKSRCSLCVVPAVFTIACTYVAIWKWQSNADIANLFSEDHNMNAGRVVLQSFAPPFDALGPRAAPPPHTEAVCREGDAASKACAFSWCEAELRSAGPGTCTCFRSASPWGSCGTAQAASVAARFVGTAAVPLEDFLHYFSREFLGNQSHQESMGLVFNASIAVAMNETLPPELLQVWETSEVRFEHVVRAGISIPRISPNSSCGWEDTCFCGLYKCKPQLSWEPNPFVIPSPPTLPTLQTTSGVVLNGGSSIDAAVGDGSAVFRQRSSVQVVFGLRTSASAPLVGPRSTEPLWDFEDAFKIVEPSVQRDMYTLCMETPPELRVVGRSCWIEDFRQFLLNRGERFPRPASPFQGLLFEFLAERPESSGSGGGSSGRHPSEDYLWLSGGEVKACFLSFEVEVDMRLDPSSMLQYREAWDHYLGKFNELSQDSGGAWHTSDLWVRASSHHSFMRSSAMTLAIASMLAGLIIGVSLRSFVLSLYALLATFGVLGVTTFFIVVLTKWSIGQVEVITILLSYGYALDYSVHMLHMYASDEVQIQFPDCAEAGDLCERKVTLSVRLQRVSHAFSSVGRATLLSALVRCGIAFFLAFCSLTWFQKSGIVGMVVVPLSILIALVPLPAALLMSGPLEPGNQPCALAIMAWQYLRQAMRRKKKEKQQEERHSQPLSLEPSASTHLDQISPRLAAALASRSAVAAPSSALPPPAAAPATTQPPASSRHSSSSDGRVVAATVAHEEVLVGEGAPSEKKEP
mmetsp:Transcript_91191/g.229236  ORF Transcript_91191/g.229236 Transcript_91191/m.229236 type:complete len:1400 (-) Transcript_91191:288-4487(-)